MNADAGGRGGGLGVGVGRGFAGNSGNRGGTRGATQGRSVSPSTTSQGMVFVDVSRGSQEPLEARLARL